MMLYYWLVFVFVLGLIVGSFLNVAITRLPLEKSLIWPGSRCGACHRRIRCFDNLPLVSYLWLRGRCRACDASFSPQYFVVELLTGLGFVGLFYLEVAVNLHGWHDPTPGNSRMGFYHWSFWAAFSYHAVLFALLLAASVTDLNGREIPLPLTLAGTVIGLIGATLMPWPWPWTPAPFPAGATPVGGPGVPPGWEWLVPDGGLREGIQPWPFWGPLPGAFAPGGNWQTGLATGVAGALVGTYLMRGMGSLFSAGLRKEALGLGDADLMMMVGAFLGWQIVVVALFVSVIPAAVFGVVQMVVHRDNSLPFGPSLAAGSLLTYCCWQWRPAELQMLLFSWKALLGMAIFAAVFLFVSSVVIRTARPSQAEIKG
ncbi:MAG: prepilin peptidase [Gemmataceae bacterium]|nr:prepilin peptidase [Gemmataceae bacterium]